MAATSAWSKDQPSGSSSIRDGDDTIRSDKSVLQATLDQEHYFTPQTSASSASGGIHRPGSGRVFFGTRASLATPSSADSAGRLFFATDTASLHYLAASSHSTIAGGSEPVGAKGRVPNTNVASGGGGTAIAFSTEDYDVGGMFTAGGSIITSTESGRYLVTGWLSYVNSVHSGTIREMWVTAGGDIVAKASSGTQSGSTRPICLNVATVVTAASGAAFQLLTYQDSGVQLGASDMSGSLAVQKI